MSPHSLHTIDDLLADPLIQSVMRADAVDAGSLKVLLTNVGARVAGTTLDLRTAQVRFGAEPRPRPAPLARLLPPPLSLFADCEARCCC